MSFPRLISARQLSVFVALFTVACADHSLPTSASNELTRISSPSAALTAAPRHLVYFTGNDVPSDFDATITSLGGQVAVAHGAVGIAVVEGLSSEAAAQLAASSGVSAVDEDYVFQFLDNATASADAIANEIYSPTNPAGAAAFSLQWNMRAIGAPAAWAAGYLGDQAVKVAILDTGIDYLHPDLVGRVDLENSASFVASDDALVRQMFPGRLLFTDLHVHGTHVASTVSSNAYLTAGVGSRTTLMAVKTVGVTGAGSVSSFLNGLMFATDRGADIINMSFGVRELLDRKEKETKAFQRMVERVFNYAHSKGVLVVVAAGNEAMNLDQKQTYKGYCSSSSVICVSATTSASQPASYTNFGVKNVDIAAPGGNAANPIWGPCSTSTLLIPQCRTSLVVIGLAGTSQAAPHVAGAAALVLSASHGAQPGSVEETLLNSATDLGEKGKDPYFGRGLLNVARALGL